MPNGRIENANRRLHSPPSRHHVVDHRSPIRHSRNLLKAGSPGPPVVAGMARPPEGGTKRAHHGHTGDGAQRPGQFDRRINAVLQPAQPRPRYRDECRRGNRQQWSHRCGKHPNSRHQPLVFEPVDETPRRTGMAIGRSEHNAGRKGLGRHRTELAPA